MMNLNKTNSMYDFINFKLGDTYNNSQLLNDFHHLLYQHKKEEFDNIYTYLIEHIGTKCNASNCDILQRNNHEFNLSVEHGSISGNRNETNYKSNSLLFFTFF